MAKDVLSGNQVISDTLIYGMIKEFEATQGSLTPEMLLKVGPAGVGGSSKIPTMEMYHELIGCVPPSIYREFGAGVTSGLHATSQIEVGPCAILSEFDHHLHDLITKSFKGLEIDVIEVIKTKHTGASAAPLGPTLKYEMKKCFISVFKIFHMKYVYSEFQIRGSVKVEVESVGNDGVTFPKIPTTLDIEKRMVV